MFPSSAGRTRARQGHRIAWSRQLPAGSTACGALVNTVVWAEGRYSPSATFGTALQWRVLVKPRRYAYPAAIRTVVVRLRRMDPLYPGAGTSPASECTEIAMGNRKRRHQKDRNRQYSQAKGDPLRFPGHSESIPRLPDLLEGLPAAEFSSCEGGQAEVRVALRSLREGDCLSSPAPGTRYFGPTVRTILLIL
jgi:hypothetical protein